MSRGYGQYCPLSLALEVLGERWTMLVVSRLIDGCQRFNEIHRGVPRMSATLLSQRLAQLEHAGILERSGKAYLLTEAGRALEPIIMDLAVWGQHWARDMTTEDLDPGFLVWSMHTRLNTEAMPPGRTVMEFEFTGAPPDCRRFWLVNDDGVVEMCLKHPGYEVDLKVASLHRGLAGTAPPARGNRRRPHSGRGSLGQGPRLSRLVAAEHVGALRAAPARCRARAGGALRDAGRLAASLRPGPASASPLAMAALLLAHLCSNLRATAKVYN